MVIDHIRCASAIIAAVCLYPRRTRKDDDGRVLRSVSRQDSSVGGAGHIGWRLEGKVARDPRLDNDCRELSPSGRQLLRRELANQIDHEVLRFSDPEKGAVFGIAQAF